MNLPFVITPGQPFEFTDPGDFFRILSSQAPLDVRFYLRGKEVAEALQVTEGYAERWRGEGFDRLVMTSGTEQTVQFVTRLGAEVFFDAPPVGDTAIVSSVPLALDAATLASLNAVVREVPTYGASHDSTTALGAAGTETVFTPAANVNGAIIWSAGWNGFNGGTAVLTSALIAHTAAPGGFTSGDVLMVCDQLASVAGGLAYSGRLQHPVRVPAGKGAYFFSAVAESAAGRHVLFTLL